MCIQNAHENQNEMANKCPHAWNACGARSNSCATVYVLFFLFKCIPSYVYIWICVCLTVYVCMYL